MAAEREREQTEQQSETNTQAQKRSMARQEGCPWAWAYGVPGACKKRAQTRLSLARSVRGPRARMRFRTATYRRNSCVPQQDLRETVPGERGASGSTPRRQSTLTARERRFALVARRVGCVKHDSAEYGPVGASRADLGPRTLGSRLRAQRSGEGGGRGVPGPSGVWRPTVIGDSRANFARSRQRRSRCHGEPRGRQRPPLSCCTRSKG